MSYRLVGMLCADYVDNVMGIISRTKVYDTQTGEYKEPNKTLVQKIEKRIFGEGVVEEVITAWRISVLNRVAKMFSEGKIFCWDTDPQLKIALESIEKEYGVLQDNAQ